MDLWKALGMAARMSEPGFEFLLTDSVINPVPGDTIPVAVKRIHPAAQVPTHKHEGDAADDVYAPEAIRVPPHGFLGVKLGIAIALPIGWKANLRGRSGLAIQHGLIVGGGLVDEGWTDEINAILINPTDKPLIFEKGARVAQIEIEPYYRIDWHEVDELPQRSRAGGKGLGSTGI